METKNIIGIAIVVLLAALLAVSVLRLANGNNATGAAVTSNKADNQGFSSYEEMMEAHHGGSQGSVSQGVGGCGGTDQAVSHDSAPKGTGQKSAYGVTYDEAGYNELLKYADTISLNAEQTKRIVGLDVQIPCCGFVSLQASGNCECGHHVSLYGLAKFLASKGYTKENIQAEIDKWKLVFYPAGNSGGTGGC